MTMRFPILIAMLCLLQLGVHAQRFGGGVHLGFISSQILEYGYPTTYDKVGFSAGGFTDYRFTPNSTLQMELNFIQKGTRQSGTLKNNNVQFGVQLNYIEMPLLYRWWGIRNMTVEIGPMFGILVSSKEWQDSPDFSFDNLNYKEFHRFDLSAAGGLSYFFLRSRLEVNARYAISVIPMRTRAQGVGIWPVARQYNSVFALSVRWWFKNTYDAPPKKDKGVRNLE